MAHPAKKTFTGKLSRLQQKWQERTLCESHAFALQMPTGTYHRAIRDTFEDETSCDACSISHMRALGVL